MRLPFAVVRSRPRLFGCALAGAVIAAIVGFALPRSLWTTRSLLGWDAAVVLYLVIVGRMMASATAQTIREKATALDEGRLAILAGGVVAAISSTGAIFAELGIAKEAHGLERAGHVGLAIVTILLSWFFLHFLFALHYAHEYFFESDIDHDGVPDPRGGLHFPETEEPRYIDFLYYAYTIGVAAQTADVETTSRGMRVFTLTHSIVAFFFNTAILALAINIAASLD